MLDAAADSDDFEPDKIWLKKRVVSELVKRTARRRSSKKVAAATTCLHSTAARSDAATASDASAKLDKTELLSRIYICSRTHTQLSQLIKGLKSTVYTPSMAVLGSRDQLCINPAVMLSETKNDDCSKLIGSSDGSGCALFQNANILSNHPSMRVVWDIEDIVTKGRQFRACPYYAAKDIAGNADVVFCPYNYMLDKLFRESAGIDLKNNIVIFDEAHNLEDQCREAASFVITIPILTLAIDMISTCQKFPNCPAEASSLREAFCKVRSWVQSCAENLSSDGAGDQLVEYIADHVLLQLISMDLTHENVKDLASKAGKVKDWHKEVMELGESPDAFRWVCPNDGKAHTVVPAFTVCMRTVDMLLLVAGYAHETKSDYAICVQRKSTEAELKVNIWCLNPGVAFKDLREQCRSVVLTSGK
jgi:Fanconi anemia group J protein